MSILRGNYMIFSIVFISYSPKNAICNMPYNTFKNVFKHDRTLIIAIYVNFHF